MEHLRDTFKHKGRRRQLIEELAQMGIQDQRILSAFDAIPRHYFLDLAFDEQAYTNMAFQIGSGQTISHPYTVAFQTELLQLEKACAFWKLERVLVFRPLFCVLWARGFFRLSAISPCIPRPSA